MKVTVVMENCIYSGGRTLSAEQGLSLLLETENRKILVDAGVSAAVVSNLTALGVHPRELDMVVISHGHWDHTGGLAHLLAVAGKSMPIYAHPQVFQERYSLSRGQHRHAGIPFTQESLVSLGAKFQWVERPFALSDDLWISGTVPRNIAAEIGDPQLVLPDGENHLVDRVIDDMSLFHRGENGLTVISGCAHSGLMNTVTYGLKILGAEQLAGWIGGTHLGMVGREQQQITLAALKKWQPKFLAANHCTGFLMQAEIQRQFPDQYRAAAVGDVVVWQ